jgi:hypothetical protein
MKVINLALVLIESLVQNCRRPFHMQIAQGDGGKKFFESLKKVAMVRGGIDWWFEPSSALKIHLS